MGDLTRKYFRAWADRTRLKAVGLLSGIVLRLILILLIWVILVIVRARVDRTWTFRILSPSRLTLLMLLPLNRSTGQLVVSGRIGAWLSRAVLVSRIL